MKTDKIKIRLTVDLTKYSLLLVKGVEGIALPRNSSILDCDTDCQFQGVKIRVANNSFEIIDEEYLAQLAELKVKLFKEYLTATSVIKKFGKRGGFQGLQISFKTDAGYTTTRTIRNRDEANDVEKMLRDAGKVIVEEIEV